MNVLVIGGSGYVGGLVLPYLAERFNLTIFDRQLPADPSWDFIRGDVTDPAALLHAMKGIDALLYMAMGVQHEGRGIQDVVAAHDVNVKGLHLALEAAAESGVRCAVYTSSLSVYEGHLDIRSGATDREDILPQPHSVYGFTKWLGEEVCRFVHRKHGLPILALRLYHPVSQEQWRARRQAGHTDPRTSAPDLARALAAALEYDHKDFEVIHVTGDTTGSAYSHEKAKRLLNWEPLEGK